MKKLLCICLALLMLASCAAEKTIATVGDIKITQGEFEFYLESIKSQLSGTELKTDEDWQTQEIEGEKAIDVAKQRALSIAVRNAEYSEIAKLAGIELTSEDENDVKETKNRIISSNGGETGYKEYLKENNISDKFIDMMCRSTVYYNKLVEEAISQKPITGDECEKYFADNKDSFDYWKAKHILIMTVDEKTRQPKSEEEQAAAKALCDEIFARLKSGEDFDTLMHQYSEDPGLSTNPDGYVFTSGEMVPEFEQTTDSLAEGEIGICESSYGYHIIMRVPLLYTDIADKVESKVADERVNALLKVWEEEYKLEKTTNEELLKTIQ